MSQDLERNNKPSLTMRIFWTLLLVAISIAGSWVVLPGIDREALDELLHLASPSANTLASSLSVVALGLTPFITAAFLVEILALLVPRWRTLRYGGLASRQRLHRAALWLTLVIAAIQAYFITSWLRAATYTEFSWLPPIWPNPGRLPALLIVLTLTAGVFALLALARGIERLGLGNGIAMLIAGGQLWTWGQQLARLPGAAEEMAGDLPTPVALIAAAFLITMIVLATRLILRKRTAAGRLPLCGLTPLVFTSSLAWFATPLAMFNLALPPWFRAMPGAAQVALVFTLAVLLSLLLFREERLPQSQPRPQAWPETAISAAFLLGLLGAQQLLAHVVGATAVDVLAVVVITAIAADSLDELRFRSAYGPLHLVWSAHSVAGADAAVAALRGAGIPALARGVGHRSLWRFFGPHLTLDVLVPVPRIDAAQGVLAAGMESLFARAAPPSPLAAPPPTTSPSARRALWLVPLLLFLVTSAGLGWRYAPTTRIVLAAQLGAGLSPAAREAALAQDIKVVKERLHALKVWPFWIRSVADRIHIWLPQRTAAELLVLTNLLTSNARLEFKLAEVGSDYLQQLTDWATQQQAHYPELRVEETEFSRPHDGTRIRDRYVTAPDRAVLQRFLSELPPAQRPAADRELVIERLPPSDSDDPAPRYRTHLVHRTAALSGQDIINAEPTLDRISGHYSIALTFSAEGGQRFADFTAAHIGERLTIELNGEVNAAPVIHSAIRGGHAQISLGSASSLADQHDEGQRLATLLRGGALNTPLYVISSD